MRLASLPTILLALGLAPVFGQAAPARTACETCHSRAAADHQNSAHKAAGVNCVTCHGGNPNDVSVAAMSRANGFRGVPKRAEQPAFCARCHSDRSVMRSYGLPTNQYADYQESGHGKALAKGITKVAVCSDCHTPHAIRKVDDPRSSVARANLPKTCARCHSDKALMDSFGLPSWQYAKYVTSVHGKSLLQGGSEGAPNCASCHGSHGAAPPQVQSLQHVCAQCHPNTAELFLGGEHHQAVAGHKMTACVTCHDPHAAPHPTDDLLHSACQQCHKAGDPAAATAEEIFKTLQEARASFAEAEKTAKDDTLGLLPEKEMMSRLDEAKTALMQAAVAQHSAKLRDVERFTQVVTGFSDDLTSARRNHNERIALRRFALVYIWGFLLVSIFSIAVQRRRGDRARALRAGNGGGSAL